MINPLLGQPLRLIPYYEPRFCRNGSEACYLHQPTDPIRMQFRQITSGLSPFACDPIFAETGSEEITNGGFTGSASGWTLINANYGSDKVCFDGSGSSSIEQSPVTLDPTKIYKIMITVSGLTSGTFDIIMGGSTIQNIYTDGLYVIDSFPGSFNNVSFVTVDGCNACIDDVSVKQLWPCWAYDNSNFYAFYNSQTQGNKITHIAGSATTFTSAGALIQDDFYQCKIRVQGRTQGTVQMFAGDLDIKSTPISKNGIFTQYLTANQTGASTGDPVDFFFVMSSDFDGTIEYIYPYVLRQDFVCTLMDSNGVPVADLSSHLSYFNDFVTLAFTGLNSILDFNGDHLDYGCYSIGIIDKNGTNYATNGHFDVNSSWFGSCYFGTWFDSGQATGVANGIACTPTELVQANAGMVMGKYYVARFKYKSNFIDAGNNIQLDVCGTTVGNVVPTTSFQTFTSAPFQITNPANQVRFHFDYGDITNGNSMTIDDVEIFAYDQYQTNCINYQLVHKDTYLVMGRTNFIAASGQGSRYGFGFLFQPLNLYIFFLIQRLKLGFRKPKYPDKFSEGEYSTGRHYKSFASSEKVFEVVFEDTGETQHDCLAITIQCPEFYIQRTDGVVVDELAKFHCITDEYAPLYDELGANLTYPSVIQVQHLTDILKISNV